MNSPRASGNFESPPSAAYTRQWTGSTLVQAMACRLFGVDVDVVDNFLCLLNLTTLMLKSGNLYQYHCGSCLGSLRHKAISNQIIVHAGITVKKSFISCIYGAVCIQLTNQSYDDCKNTCTLSYYHQIGSITHLPLFIVRSWSNGMPCISFYVLMQTFLVNSPRSNDAIMHR